MDGTAFECGAEIDGFQVLEKVHSGSMATLYRVSRPDVSLPLLMKVPELAFGAHPACHVGFEVEQAILAKLTGPHVPRFVARGELDGVGYLVMERIDGTPLREIATQAPLPAGEVARLGRALATALRDIHRQGVVHLDVKPANILLRPDGEAVLIDFGLSYCHGLPDLVDEAFHAPVGTGAYISPEQILGVRCEPRSDLFALGVMLYQLATGRLPFGSPASLRAFRRRLHLRPVPPRAANPEVPAWLQEVILRCLEVRWQDRYPTAAQVAHDLAQPDQIAIGWRGRHTRSEGLAAKLRHWLDGYRIEPPPCPVPAGRIGQAEHILVALDTTGSSEALVTAMRNTVQRLTASEPHCRVSCLSILELSALTEGDGGRELVHSLYTQRLVELRHWARSLPLPTENLRFHVVEAGNAAHALLEFAAQHHVDLIVIGARGASTLRRLLGSVSSRVATEADCSVLVVRADGR